MSATGLQIVSRNHNVCLPLSEYEEAKGIADAYKLTMLISNTPYISPNGLEIAIRVQAYLCREYNRVLLKGWRPNA